MPIINQRIINLHITNQSVRSGLLLLAVGLIILSTGRVDAQIAAANLDNAHSMFHNPEVTNYNFQEDYILYPQSSYVLSPHSSGWRKSSSVNFTSTYITLDPTVTDSESGTVTKQDKGTNNTLQGGVTTSFIVNRDYFVDINGRGGTIEFSPAPNDSPKIQLDRTVSGFNVNIGARLIQILSVGFGVSQVNINTTYKVDSDEVTVNHTEQTYGVGASLRLGNLFIGGGADIEVKEDADRKNGSSAETKMKTNRYSKFYGGIGLSMGHPRDSELHVEVSGISIPETTLPSDGSSDTYFIRQAYTEYALTAEFIYFDFYFMMMYKLGTITGVTKDSYTMKDAAINTGEIGMGYSPAKNLFFMLKAGSVDRDQEITFTSGDTQKIAANGYAGTFNVGYSF